MGRFAYLRRSRRQVQVEIDDELRAHLEMRVDDLIAQGLTPDEARAQALRQFGNLEYTRRYCRVQDTRKEARMRWRLLVDELRQDLRQGLRQILHNPGFSAVIVITVALGIGANTALFSIFNSLILRPLPVRDPERLALLANGSWSYPIWTQVRAQENALFDGALAWSPQRFDLSTSGRIDIVDAAFVSGRFFDVLGVTAVRGRMLAAGDDDGAAVDGPVAVISHRLWQERFGGKDDVLGRPLSVQRVPFTVVGVMPADFFGPDVGRTADVMLPFAAEPILRGKESRLKAASSRWLQIMVRLQTGQSLDQATAALRALQPPIVQPWTRTARPLSFVSAATGNSALRRRFESPLRVMVAAVALVFLVACGNIASLILARTLTRRREMSVRLALGSSRGRIARLLFTESAILAAAGAALGLAFAFWAGALLVRQLNTWQSTVSLDLVFDWRVLAFTAGFACVSAVVASVLPAFAFTRVPPGDALKAEGRGNTADGRFFARGALVVLQLAMSCVLVVTAGLFLRTFASLHQLPLGFNPEPLAVMEFDLQASGGPLEARAARVERLREAAASVAGVRSASLSAIRLLPGANTGWSTSVAGVGDEVISRAQPSVWLNATTPGWFDTMGIAIKSGRDFLPADRVGSAPVAIVNETFARRYLRGGSAVGQRVRLGFDPRGFDPVIGEGQRTMFEIVGVVGDTAYTTPREGMAATFYTPVAQRNPAAFWETMVLTINAAPGARARVARDAAEAITKADPAIAFASGTFDDLVDATVTQERLTAVLAAFFGGLALLLAAIGLYGLVAHSVRTRRAEIGLRIALGAASSSILRLIFTRVGFLVLAGLALGLAGSFWASRFVGALLFELDARDPLTFAAAAAVLVSVGGVAAWLPARHAARVDPALTLRGE